MITVKSYFDFKKAYNKKNSYGNRHLVLYIRKNNSSFGRVGFTVSKKVGKAVVRNRIRRRLKELYRQAEPSIPEGYDLIFVAKKNVGEISFKELKSAFFHILKISGMKK